jgi:hypothetical protein
MATGDVYLIGLGMDRLGPFRGGRLGWGWWLAAMFG